MTFQRFVIVLWWIPSWISAIFSYFEAANIEMIAHFRDLERKEEKDNQN